MSLVVAGAVAFLAIALIASVAVSLAFHRRSGPVSAALLLLHGLVGLGGLIMFLVSLYAWTSWPAPPGESHRVVQRRVTR